MDIRIGCGIRYDPTVMVEQAPFFGRRTSFSFSTFTSKMFNTCIFIKLVHFGLIYFKIKHN